MMQFFSLLLLCCSSLAAQGIFSSPKAFQGYESDAITFYEVYLAEQRGLNAHTGLTSEGGQFPSLFSPPPNPPAPAFVSGYLPVVLVNRSGYPDSQVYFLVTGKNLSANNCWGNINTSSGIATLQQVQSGDTSLSFMVPLSNLPRSSTGRVAYLPQTISGLFWFSIGSPLSMGVSGGGIVQPNPSSPSDPNYNINYDVFEYDFQLNANINSQVACDATAVSFFSIPLYGYLAGATTSASHTGLYHPRSYIFSKIVEAFNSAPLNSQWNKLVLTNAGKTLRALSPALSMSVPEFDSNYLDDASLYGYSYISDVWDGASSFYRNNPCNMSVTVTSPSTETYTYSGTVQGDNTFLFTSTNGGPNVTFLAPTTAGSQVLHTSYLIFAAQNLTVPGGGTQPIAGTADDTISKLFEEALIAGLVPTTNTLSLSYLADNQANFYQVNSNLSAAGKSSGPWYDLYSKTLHGLGSIYTFGFDEPLWPSVLLESPFKENSTYIGITISNCEP